jgi:hypothetical protein
MVVADSGQAELFSAPRLGENAAVTSLCLRKHGRLGRLGRHPLRTPEAR